MPAGAIATATRAEDAEPLVAQSGDALLISVLEDPSLDREAKVDAAGRIMLPRMDSIAVAGLSLDEVREAVAAALKAEGIIRDPTVVVDFAAYRQVYVDGAVATPGAVPYEPGLTVRKAIVLAGGLSGGNGTGGASVEDLLTLNSAWRANAFAMVEVQSRIGRLKAELDGRKDGHAVGAADPAVSSAALDEIRTLDRNLLSGNLDLRLKDKAHIEDLLDLTDFLLGVLEEQARHQEAERALQREEVEGARTLAERGMMPQTRLRDLEREESRLGREILEVKAYIARTRQEKETLAYELSAADQKQTVELESRIRDAVLERTALEQEAELLAAQVLAKGIALSETYDLAAIEPTLVIHRTIADREQTLPADMSTVLRPGDVLEASYQRTAASLGLGQ